MDEIPAAVDRRTFLQAAALLVLASAGTVPLSAARAGTGKGIGDFDFLAGEWKIANRRLKDGSTSEWQEFEGGATVHRVLGGMGSIEELRGAGGKYLGMGVRVWRPQEQVWADHWTGYYNGVVNPPQMGRFIDGAGVFISEDVEDGQPVQYRGLWDEITPTSCRWSQASSRDGGKTWVDNWVMRWTRV